MAAVNPARFAPIPHGEMSSRVFRLDIARILRLSSPHERTRSRSRPSPPRSRPIPKLSETELRVRALESILTEKGYVDPASLDLLIDLYEKKIGPAQRRSCGLRKRGPIRPIAPPTDGQTRPRPLPNPRLHGAARREHGGGREHARAAQYGRVYAVLLLSASRAGPAAGLV